MSGWGVDPDQVPGLRFTGVSVRYSMYCLYIDDIQAEQEERNVALRKIDLGPELRLAERYAGGI